MGRIRLASLKLTGFKSFADPAELVFPSDITAIVGPNGVGKSNLVDAILWVLGEQSPSLLRLKDMRDTIFSGAHGRKPAGAAEVVLTLVSDDGRWSSTGGELVISRRVMRSGGSGYRLNGRSVRLRDISNELLRIGLGTRAYSIIGQNRVGQVLSARPTDRRMLLEEAAGITHYRARKRDAELKLAQTRQNLERLDDVIAEVDRSRRQLKRQARQAERYRVLEDELKANLRALYGIRIRTAALRRERTGTLRAQLQNEGAAAASALGGAEADLAAARQQLEEAHVEVEAARSEVAALASSGERLSAFLERSADLLDTMRASLVAAKNQAEATVSTRETLATRLAQAQSHLKALESSHEEIVKKKRDAAGVAKAAREAFQAAQREASEQRQSLLRMISSLTETRNRLTSLERERDRLTYTLSQLEQEHERLNARHEAARGRLDAAQADVARASGAATQTRGQRDAVASRRDASIAAAQEAGRRAESLSHRSWEIKHRLTGIEHELSRHAAALDQVAAFVPSKALAGQVSSFLHPRGADAALLDRVWHDVLELPVVKLDSLPPRAVETAAGMDARIRLAYAGRVDPPEFPAPVEGAEPLMPLAGIAPEEAGWLAAVLPPAYRTDDEASARRLAAAHPWAIFLAPDGTLHRGRTVELPSAGSELRGALELRGELEELTQRLLELDAKAAAARALEEEHNRAASALEDELAGLNEALLEAEEVRARAAAVERSEREELGRLERELEVVAAETGRSRNERAAIERRLEALEAEVTSLEQRSSGIELALDKAGTTVEARREEAGRALRELDRFEAEERLTAERVEAAREEAARLASELCTIENRQEELGREVADLEARLAKTEDEVVRSRTRLAEEHGLLAGARERERRAADEVELVATRVAALEKEVRERRAAHEQARSRLHEIEVEQTRVEAEWEALCEGAGKELGLDPGTLLEETAAEDAVDETLQSAVDDLRAKLERMGPVNLLAVQEAGELDARSAFLHEQRDDLLTSLASLGRTIREIDATCTERFVETFEKVNAVFAETFSHLFGGGTARLDLADEDDPLESGVLITAQPPGKKNQSVQLLSGGERALAALALLIALFRIKPSPVCIFDEVDASLDGANIVRLMELVKDMSGSTQFVLITHNRRTMMGADVLYGVTMERPGVSKLVSVRLEE